MKELQKVVTRYYLPITMQAWSEGAIREMEKVLGVGFSDMIVEYDGRKMENYRLKEETNTVIKRAMLEFFESSKFLNGISAYRKLMEEYDKALKGKSLKKVYDLAVRLYPLLGVCYIAPALFDEDIKKNRKRVLELCTEYRLISEGYINKMNLYVYDHCNRLGINPFCSTEMIDKKPKKVWLENGFIMSKGKFYKMPFKEFLKKNSYFIANEKFDQNSVKGFTAYGGKVKGKVKIVFSDRELSKIEKGDILVCPATQVTFVPILKKAAAIVTDEGSITSHAAIISREMKIPCVIGTKHATKIFEDGDMIEVDANSGIVRKL